MADQFLPITVFIDVTGGTGTATFKNSGVCIGVGFKPPSGTSEYDFEFIDQDNFGLVGKIDKIGNTTTQIRFQCHDATTINLTNCTEDGLYRARVWFDE
jgi:hypothetical protein